jgi:predicted dehydrogenase
MSESSAGKTQVRVGIIGLSASGGFAAGAHVPALQALDGYELRGCSASSPGSAAAAAARHDVPLAFDSAELLAASKEIDLVVVTVKTPYHYELVMAALQAGKTVLCEWPLGNGSAQSAELAAEADRRGVRTAVGLQARSAASVLFLRDLVADGYVGEVLSTTIMGSGVTYGAQVPPAARYSLDPANGATMLSIPMGHTLDAACLVLGEFTDFTATLTTRRPVVHDSATGEPLPMSVPDQVAVSGRLENGAVASVHYRGGLSQATNLHWEINGTEGDLVVTGQSGHLQLADVQIRGARAADAGLSELEVPEKYERAPGTIGQSARIRNVANAYAQLLDDIHTGSSVVPTFAHAARRHAMLDAIAAASRR